MQCMDCFHVVLSLPLSATTNCSPDNPLSCAAGDLTAKHGPLPFGVSRYVIHDPYLPLSGSNGVVSAVLLVQPANGVGDSVCVAITEVTMTTTIIATPIPTPSMTSATDLSPGSTSTATRPQTQSPSTTASPPGSKRTGRLCSDHMTCHMTIDMSDGRS